MGRGDLRVFSVSLLTMLGMMAPLQLQAACSTSYLDKAYLNEYYFFASDPNYLEVIIPNNNKVLRSEWQNWTIRVYTSAGSWSDYSLADSDPHVSVCEFGSKSYITWTQNTSLDADLPAEGRQGNAILLDGAGNEIDYLKFAKDSGSIVEWVPHQCSYSASHDIDAVYGSGNKNLARFPDATGDWSYSALTGSGTTNTKCASNDPSVVKSVSAASIPVSTTVNGSFTIAISNPSNQNQTSVVVTDTWPAGLSYDSYSATLGTYNATTGIWSVGTLAKNSSATLTLNFHGTTVGSYTNTANLSYSGITYPASDTAIANIAPALDHLRLTHTGSGLTCQPAVVTVEACSNAACTSLYGGSVTATLTPSGWSGGDTVTFSGGSATFNLAITTAGTYTLGVSSSNPATSSAATCFDGASNSCAITFYDSGFVFDVPNLTAALDSPNVLLKAVRKDLTTQRCVPAFASTTKPLNFWSSYINPNSGTLPLKLTIGGTSQNIATSAPGTAFNVPFDANGEALLIANYPDVGLLQLDARHTAGTLTMSGSDQFVVKPHHFSIDSVKRSSDNVANPAAADANGAVFIAAGNPFTVTTTARNALNAATPNYGKESAAESVKLGSTLILPSPGNNPAITATTGFGTFTNGSATGTDFSWGEVGIITLTPSVKDGDYLGAGDVTGTVSGNVGRFIPHHFAISAPVITNRSDYTSCSSAFTYLGEPFKASFALTAQNAANATTQNYTGAFAKLALATPANLAIAAIDQGSPVTPLGPRLSVISSSGSWSNGVATTAAELSVAKATSPDGPFNSVAIGTLPKDSDNVTMLATALNLDSDNNGSNDHYTLATTRLYHGRLSLIGACGSTNATLSMPLTVQYYDGSNGNFVNNSSDSCTTVNVALNPNPNGSCIWDNPTTPLSGSNACATAAPAGKAFIEPPLAGSYNLWLKGGASGTVGITASMQTGASYGYLQYPWSGASASDTTRNATFGIFCRDNMIYMRDLY